MLAARLKGEEEKKSAQVRFLALAKAQKKFAAAPSLNRFNFSNSAQGVSSIGRNRTKGQVFTLI